MAGQSIESSLIVSKITDTHAGERTIAVVLKGVSTITHDNNGYELVDIVDIEVKLKFAHMKTARRLGVGPIGVSKVVVLRDRDNTLQKFDALVQEGASLEIVEA